MNIDKIKADLMAKLGNVLTLKQQYYRYVEKVKKLPDSNEKQMYISGLETLKNNLDNIEKKAMNLSSTLDKIKIQLATNPELGYNILFSRDVWDLTKEALNTVGLIIKVDNDAKVLFSSIDKKQIPSDIHNKIGSIVYGLMGVALLWGINLYLGRKR